MPSYGKVALSALMPLLAYGGHEVFALPSGLVSNTLDYGKFVIEDTTAYMEKSLATYKELGFTFDCLCTGFLVNPKQVQIIKQLKKENPQMLLIVDPIMADDGKLYNGMDENTVARFRSLCSIADIIIPNITESLLLCDMSLNTFAFSKDNFRAVFANLRSLQARSIVITSCKDEYGQHCVVGYDHRADAYFKLPYEHIDVRFAGTGDIFSGIMVNALLAGKTLEKAVLQAMSGVSKLLAINMAVDEKLPQDHFKGLQVEPYLKDIV